MYKIINRKKLFATIIADLIGNMIFFPSRLLKKRGEIRREEVREILVIRTAYIGDVVMTVPVLKPLKERFPDARISFLTSRRAGEILENNPYLDEIITYDPFWFYPSHRKDYLEFIGRLRKKSFDLVIEARADIREILFLVWPIKAKFKVSYDVGGGGYLLTNIVPYKGLSHKVEYHLDIARYLGCKIDGMEWGIYLSEEEDKRAAGLLLEEGVDFNRPIVAIHPGARKELKCWSTEGFAQVADILIERYGVSLIMTGSADEAPIAREVRGTMKNKCVDLTGKTTLREMAGVITKCSLFICNDSSPMHIAAALNIPTVAIFGPSKSIETAPYGNQHIVVEKDFPCRHRCDEDICHFVNHHQCMKDISDDNVISAIEKMAPIWIGDKAQLYINKA